jgi:ABC-type polysaccharide/polyol phosphate transport system ATPase subunit
MVSIAIDGIGLRYPVAKTYSLSMLRPGARAAAQPAGGSVGGAIAGTSGKRYVEALQAVSFALDAGDRLALVGANGSGKTTLLKVLYGIYPPTSGRMRIEGRVDALFNINLGFRREATGRRNIYLRGLINGWKPETIRASMDDIVAFSELGDFIDMPFKTYSQGMAARLAFAVATTLEPEILLMDEWIGAGDPAFQAKARERMTALADKAGIIVLASHNHALLKNTCNKALKLEHGKVVAFGPVGEVLG